MRIRSEDRKQFLHDIFVCALEGGIGYWSQCSNYRWAKPDGSEDLDGFGADIIDIEDDDKAYRIDINVISRGVNKIAKAQAPYWQPNGPERTQCADVEYLTGYCARTVRAASFENDASEIDADLADQIVQVGLFGKVVYG